MNPIYLFLGVNQYQIEQDIEKIIQKSNVDELSLSKYNCDEVLVDEAIHDCMTLSFFEANKVVIINNPTFLTTESTKLEHNNDLFMNYIQKPNETTILIINACNLTIDKRKTIVKQVMKVAKVISYENLTEDQAKKVIQERFSQMNKKIGFEAINELITRTSGDTLQLYSELDKLTFYLDSEKEVTLEDIKLLVAEPLEHNIFNLTNYIIEGLTEKAIKSYHKLVQQNEEPLVFSSVLAKNFHLMYLIKQYQKKGYYEHQLKSVLKIHPFQLKKLFQITQRTNESVITHNIERLTQYDHDVKTGRVDKYLGFELFVLQQANS
jgi:DNA polymerase III subunit delta